MILDNDTLQILKNFASINQSIVFRPGEVQTTISPSRTIFAKATLKEAIDRKFAIYDLSRFLSVVSLYKEPKIELDDNFLTIISGNQKIRYMYAAEETILAPKGKDPKLPSIDVTLTVTSEVFESIDKAMAVMKLPDFAFVGIDGDLFALGFDSKNPTSDHYQVNIGTTDKTFKLIFRKENLKVLPLTYHVEISSSGVSKWMSDNIHYWIAVESNSTFEKD